MIGHTKVKPIFLSLPERLYSDDGGSGYSVAGTSYLRATFLGLFVPVLFSGCVLLMISDMAMDHSAQFRIRNTRAGCTAEQLDEAHMLHYLHF